MVDTEIHPLTPERLGDYLEFFEHSGFVDNPEWSGCFCFFPYHDPESGPWQDRSAAVNRRDVSELVSKRKAQGYLAYVEGKVVGWCNAAPRRLFPGLSRLPGPTEQIGSIPCFLVAPSHRNQGVARSLLDAACEGLRSQGLRLAEAKPVRDAKGAAANSPGPLSIYLDAGFEILHEDEQGNVFVQKQLEPPAG